MTGPGWSGWGDALARVLEALDWRALGGIYFHQEGERLLRQRRPSIVELGRSWAKALLRRLPAEGRSLYAGAGLAELPAMLAEVLVARRSVRAANLRQEECGLLGAALERAGLGSALQVVGADAAGLVEAGSCDHVAAVSLFTDPDTWPMLSAVAYGRIAPVQLDVERFVAEREAARRLAGGLWAALKRPGWITTTSEEVGWFLEQAEAAGTRAEADGEAIATAIVGDPIGFLRVP